MLPHIRQVMPRKGGNSFYRDKNDYAAFVKTLCGAAVTDKDFPFRDGKRAVEKQNWPVCGDCADIVLGRMEAKS